MINVADYHGANELINQADLETIMQTTNRVPYTEREVEIALATAKERRKRGTDLQLGDPRITADASEIMDAAKQGLLFLRSDNQLHCGFLFVKCNAGRSMFGNQKAVFNSYIRSHEETEWLIGTTFKSWPVAITSIGNIYRAQGFN